MKSEIELRLQAIETRNKRVELDKQWETSWTRRLVIAGLTYGVVFVYLAIIDNNNPFINAFVPPVGFILSTLAIKNIKDIWQQKQK